MLTADGVGAVVEGLYRGSIDPQPLIEACATSDRIEARWVRELHAMYPDDPSVAVTLLLNLVTLAPGQTIRLDAGNLHAYLHGAGVELMGASDNVVRGGLTVKEVDVDELLRVFDPTPLADPVLPAGGRFDLPAAGVSLLCLRRGDRHVADRARAERRHGRQDPLRRARRRARRRGGDLRRHAARRIATPRAPELELVLWPGWSRLRRRSESLAETDVTSRYRPHTHKRRRRRSGMNRRGSGRSGAVSYQHFRDATLGTDRERYGMLNTPGPRSTARCMGTPPRHCGCARWRSMSGRGWCVRRGGCGDARRAAGGERRTDRGVQELRSPSGSRRWSGRRHRRSCRSSGRSPVCARWARGC